MSEIKCPNCGQVFKVDEQGYAAIMEQVRNEEFKNEVDRRVAREKEQAVELVRKDFENKLSETVGEKNLEIEKLRSAAQKQDAVKDLAVKEALDKEREQFYSERESYKRQISDNEKQIAELKLKFDSKDTEKTLAVKEALESVKAEYASEKEKLTKIITYNEKEIEKLRSEHRLELEKSEYGFKSEIAKLEADIKNNDAKNQLEVRNAVSEIEKEKDAQIAELNAAIKSKDELIDYYKDFKLQLSTKMVGESLEQHCLMEFNKLRATAFRNAYFDKDNDARTGSKGDFIYREQDDDGNEIISIMFEMKNESDATATKKKNEHFFKELDKDRREKNCEYAVLVSLLEPENEFYNAGIADVSYAFEKMYVVRPQCFIPIITILRNAAMNSLAYKAELQRVKNENIDISNFEDNINVFKEGFSKNFKNASDRFSDAIDAIDKAIKNLEDIKRNLTLSEKHLNSANNKLDDLTIKKLTRNSPTMRTKFDELKDGQE